MQIDRLKAVSIQLQNLEAQKSIAILHDNYDEAKRIKVNMEQMKYMSMMQANANLYNAPQDLPSLSASSIINFQGGLGKNTKVDTRKSYSKEQNFGGDVIVEPISLD